MTNRLIKYQYNCSIKERNSLPFCFRKVLSLLNSSGELSKELGLHYGPTTQQRTDRLHTRTIIHTRAFGWCKGFLGYLIHSEPFVQKDVRKNLLNSDLNGDFNRRHDQVSALLRPGVD